MEREIEKFIIDIQKAISEIKMFTMGKEFTDFANDDGQPTGDRRMDNQPIEELSTGGQPLDHSSIARLVIDWVNGYNVLKKLD